MFRGKIIAHRCSLVLHQANNCGVALYLKEFRRSKTQRSQHAKMPSVAKIKDKWSSAKVSVKECNFDISNSISVNKERPVDNIYLLSDFAIEPLTFAEAVSCLRNSLSCLSITNKFFCARLQLDMNTQRKTKFANNIRGLVDFPNAFDDGPANNVILFCKRNNHIELARKYGCYLYGNEDLLKMFVAGEIMDFSYDYILCTPDVYADISRLRKRVGLDRFPTQANGQLVVDLEKALKKFRFGHSYESCKLSDSLAILRMDMSDNELEENFSALMNEVSVKHTPPQGNFITSANLICPPCVDRYPINVQPYVIEED